MEIIKDRCSKRTMMIIIEYRNPFVASQHTNFAAEKETGKGLSPSSSCLMGKRDTMRTERATNVVALETVLGIALRETSFFRLIELKALSLVSTKVFVETKQAVEETARFRLRPGRILKKYSPQYSYAKRFWLQEGTEFPDSVKKLHIAWPSELRLRKFARGEQPSFLNKRRKHYVGPISQENEEVDDEDCYACDSDGTRSVFSDGYYNEDFEIDHGTETDHNYEDWTGSDFGSLPLYPPYAPGLKCLWISRFFNYENLCLAALFPNLTQLELSSNFTYPILPGCFPDTLLYLIIGCDTCTSRFNHPLSIKNLPPRLRGLDVYGSFDQPVDDLPDSITYLFLGPSISHPIDRLPVGLKTFLIGCKENVALDYFDHLPKSLNTLSIMTHTQSSYSLLPTSLRHLSLCCGSTELLDLPKSLLTLRMVFDPENRYKLNVLKSLPDSIVTLSVEEGNVRLERLPACLKTLHIDESDCDFSFAGVLPQGLERLEYTVTDESPIMRGIVDVFPNTLTHLWLLFYSVWSTGFSQLPRTLTFLSLQGKIETNVFAKFGHELSSLLDTLHVESNMPCDVVNLPPSVKRLFFLLHSPVFCITTASIH